MAWVAFYIVGSGGLTQAQQQNNGDQFYQIMSGYGFTPAACAAIWSNVLCESGGNPMAWETGQPNNGFGLTQWTPSTKIRDWASNNNMNPDDGNVQCQRINLEFTQPSTYQQYYSTTNFPESASQFKNADLNTHNIEYWSEAFTRNYERPNEDYFQRRKAQQFAYAREYYERFSGEQPPAGSYRINVNVSGNGNYELSPQQSYYQPNTQIDITLNPDDGEQVESISSSPDVGIDLDNLTFSMPSENVEIDIVFSGSGGGGGKTRTFVLRLVENQNIEVWENGRIIKYLPNEQNTFKLKIAQR